MGFFRWNSWNAIGTIVFLLLVAGNAGAIPSEQWNRTFGGKGEDWINSVQQTRDGGYILAGEYIYFVGKTARGGVENPFTGSYVWLIKTDAGGSEQWNWTYLGRFGAVAVSVQQTPDGGYIFAGMTFANAASGDNVDAWIVKVDENGTQQWNRTFGGAKDDWVSEIQLTKDNGYIIAGSYETAENLFEAWLLRLDSNGSTLWNRRFSEFEAAYSVQETRDGGYAFAGNTHHYEEMDSNIDAYIMKTDSSGGQQWKRIFGGKNDDSASSVQETLDGGFIIAGFTRSFSEQKSDADAWLIKTDATGTEQWRRTFGGRNEDKAESVRQTADGGYIFTGHTESYGVGNIDIWLVKTDPRGSQEWSRTFGGKESDKGYTVRQTMDNGYILVGKTYSLGNGGSDGWVIKISGDGAPVQTANITPAPAEISTALPTSAVTPRETLTPADIPATAAPPRTPGFFGIYAMAVMLIIVHLARKNRILHHHKHK